MPRKVFAVFTGADTTIPGGSAPFNGSAGVGGGVGTQDAGNGAGQPLFRVLGAKLINTAGGNNPGTYVFDQNNGLTWRDGANVIENAKGFVRFAGAERMGIIARQEAGNNKASIAGCMVDSTFYIFARNSDGGVFANLSQAVGVSIPDGSICAVDTLTSGTNVIVKVALVAGGTDLSNAALDPYSVTELASFQQTLDCSAANRAALRAPGYWGVFMFNGGASTEFRLDAPSVDLTAGAISAGKVADRTAQASINPSTGGTGDPVTIDLLRNGAVLAAGVSAGLYSDTTVQPYSWYTYKARYAQGATVVESAPLLIGTLPAESAKDVVLADSNWALGFGLPDNQKPIYLLSEDLKQAGRANLFINLAIAGTDSQYWATDTGGSLTAALAQATLFQANFFDVMLGTNDLKEAVKPKQWDDLATVAGPRTKARYKANMRRLADLCLAARPSAKVRFSVLGFIPDGTSEWATGAAWPALRALQNDYLAALQEICAADSRCIMADSSWLSVSEANAVLYGLVADVHWNFVASQAQAKLLKSGWVDVPYPTGTGGYMTFKDGVMMPANVGAFVTTAITGAAKFRVMPEGPVPPILAVSSVGVPADGQGAPFPASAGPHPEMDLAAGDTLYHKGGACTIIVDKAV